MEALGLRQASNIPDVCGNEGRTALSPPPQFSVDIRLKRRNEASFIFGHADGFFFFKSSRTEQASAGRSAVMGREDFWICNDYPQLS